jgi:hypothetical protein
MPTALCHRRYPASQRLRTVNEVRKHAAVPEEALIALQNIKKPVSSYGEAETKAWSSSIGKQTTILIAQRKVRLPDAS